jgi:hypothetical protein
MSKRLRTSYQGDHYLGTLLTHNSSYFLSRHFSIVAYHYIFALFIHFSLVNPLEKGNQFLVDNRLISTSALHVVGFIYNTSNQWFIILLSFDLYIVSSVPKWNFSHKDQVFHQTIGISTLKICLNLEKD